MFDRISNFPEWCGLVGLVRGFYSPGNSQTSPSLHKSARWIRTVSEVGGKIQVDYESEGTKNHPLLTLSRHSDASCRFNASSNESNELAVLYILDKYNVPIVCMDSKAYTEKNRKDAYQLFIQTRPQFFDLTKIFPETTEAVTRAYSLLDKYRID